MEETLESKLQETTTWVNLGALLTMALENYLPPFQVVSDSHELQDFMSKNWPSGTVPRQAEVAALEQQLTKIKAENERLRRYIAELSGED